MHSLIAWFARNSVAANLLMLAILVLGAWSLLERVPLEVFPEFERDVVTISVAYRGATPAEVEEAVVVRVEEVINDLDGVERIVSNAREGYAAIRVELRKGSDPHVVLNEIKSRVEAINVFPDAVERPAYSVVVFRPEVISVVVVAELSERALRNLGEQIQDELTALPEISLTELTAVRPAEIAIEISEQALNRYDLTFDAVVAAVRRTSLNLPAGSIRTRDGEILLRTKNQAYRADEFSRISVRTQADGLRLTLADIATVKDGFEDTPLAMTLNGRPAVLVNVFRSDNQSALEIGRAVREYIAGKQHQLPQGVELVTWNDSSRILELRLNTLLSSAWQGGFLIFLILTLFLRLSVAVWVCVGIPISFMGALALMPELGITVNIVSLFAFILVLGIVVDDAIITGENIYSHIKREGGSGAVVKGAQEVAVPVTFGLLTTVVAFAPLLFLEGQRGAIFAQIPLIVILVLLFSWVESKLILPAHLRHVRAAEGRQNSPLARLQARIAGGLEHHIRTFYGPVLERALQYRYLTLVLFIVGALIVVSFVISGRYGFTYFPRVDSETAQVTLIMQAGVAREETAERLADIAGVSADLQAIYVDEEGRSVIRNIMVTSGWGGGAQPVAGSSPEVGQVSIELVPPEERTVEVSTRQLVNEWRSRIGAIPGARELNFRAEIGRGGNPIDVQLIGQDFERLAEVAAAVREKLREYPGVFDIQDSFEDGKPEISLSLKPEAELLGLSAADLGRQVRQAYYGEDAQRIQRGRDEVRVIVRYPETERESLSSLYNMRIRTDDGVKVPFSHVAQMERGKGFTTIRRVDRQRIINVTADLDKQNTDARAIVADLKRFIDELLIQYPGIRYTFEGEQREQRESFNSLFFGLLFSLFSIYALLAIPFRSYLQPIVVMLVIPFSAVGALLGHMLLGMNLSIISVMGMLALAGVVVNDSLILVDWINRRRREDGMPLDEAVRTAGIDRFRPIMLTSLTTFAGLLPLIMEKSTQAQFLIPMAVSLGFGILFATVLSLLLVPVGYRILEDVRGLFFRADTVATRAALALRKTV